MVGEEEADRAGAGDEDVGFLAGHFGWVVWLIGWLTEDF